MKKVLIFICLALFTAANSQSLEINTIPGGVEIVRTSTNDTLQYSDGASLYAMIDNNNSLRIYQKLGGRVFSPYLFTDVEVNGVSFTNKKTMLNAINEISAFSAGYSLGGDSIWTTASGKIENTDTLPFVHTFTSGELVNDSIQINVFKVPFVGSRRSIGSWEYFIGQIDFSPAGGRLVDRIQVVRNSDFKSYYVDVDSLFGVTISSEIGGSKPATIGVNDTSVLVSIYDTVTTEFKQYGMRVPRISVEPSVSSANGEGLIYYNTTDSLFFGYEKGEFKPLIKQSGFASYMDTTYNSVTPYTLLADSVEKFPFRWTSKTDEKYLPYGIDSLFSRADSTLIFPQGTAFDMMLYFYAEPSNNTDQWVDVWVDIGGTIGVLYPQTFIFPKGVGTARGILYALPSAYALNTFEANGGTIYIQSNHDLEIYDSNLNIDIDYLD